MILKTQRHFNRIHTFSYRGCGNWKAWKAGGVLWWQSISKYNRFSMSIYYKTYAKLLLGFVRKNPFKEAPPVLTNSKWTAKIIEEICDEVPAVLNSPIPLLNVSIVKKPTDFSLRGNVVVMVGRFSEEKRCHWILQDLFPKLMKDFSDVKLFYLVQ
jgi:glycosyltransferase involved in cell wall biosynthesis